MVSLADLRSRNIVPTWQEAVAVVQELLHTIVAAHGSADRLPDVRHIALIANGDVVALPGSPATGQPVRHLATLLHHLLDGVPAPPQLEEFIQVNIADPPQIQTVEEFSQQMAFFERPGRRSDVEQLVARAMSSDAQMRAEEELRKLKERTVEAQEQDADVVAPVMTSRPAQSRQALVVAALLALALTAAGGTWLYGRWSSEGGSGRSAAAEEPEPAEMEEPAAAATVEQTSTAGDRRPAGPGDTPDQAGAAESAEQKAESAEQNAASESDQASRPSEAAAPSFFERTKASVSRAVRSVFGGSGTTSEPMQASAPATEAADAKAPVSETASGARRRSAPASGAARRRAASRSTPASQPPEEALQAAPPASGPQVRTEVTTPPLTGEPPMSAATTTELRTIIYTAGDAGVMPAMLVRPLLPAEPPPDVPPEQIGTLELVVNEQGDVERVRLISPSNRYHERMLVAHAKTWKFRPALRDGRPVKYRTVVRLTI